MEGRNLAKKMENWNHNTYSQARKKLIQTRGLQANNVTKYYVQIIRKNNKLQTLMVPRNN